MLNFCFSDAKSTVEMFAIANCHAPSRAGRCAGCFSLAESATDYWCSLFDIKLLCTVVCRLPFVILASIGVYRFCDGECRVLHIGKCIFLQMLSLDRSGRRVPRSSEVSMCADRPPLGEVMRSGEI
jgi:hypothetical protein